LATEDEVVDLEGDVLELLPESDAQPDPLG